jgi:hypothetical protein
VADRSAAIAGLGMTDLGKVYGRSAAQFAGDAVRLAVADAGLELGDVDGLLTSAGVSGGVGLALQRDLGLRDLRLLSEMQSYGSTAGQMVQYASLAIGAGMAETVACVFADAPLRQDTSTGAAYGARGAVGWRGLLGAAGIRARRPAAHGHLRHHERPARAHRGGPAGVGRAEPAGADAHTHDARGLPRVPLDRGAVPPARLLPGVQRRDRRGRHVRGAGGVAGPPAGARPGLGAGAPRPRAAAPRGLRPRVRRGPA